MQLHPTLHDQGWNCIELATNLVIWFVPLQWLGYKIRATIGDCLGIKSSAIVINKKADKLNLCVVRFIISVLSTYISPYISSGRPIKYGTCLGPGQHRPITNWPKPKPSQAQRAVAKFWKINFVMHIARYIYPVPTVDLCQFKETKLVAQSDADLWPIVWMFSKGGEGKPLFPISNIHAGRKLCVWSNCYLHIEVVQVFLCVVLSIKSIDFNYTMT